MSLAFDLLRASVPPELSLRRRWVVARGKRPHSAVDGSPAGWNASEDRWVTLEEAIAFVQAHPAFDGVGLVLHEDDDLVFLDLDHVVHADGTLEPWAAEILQAVPDTYAEYSVSGSGVHAFLRAPWDPKWSTSPQGKSGSHLEMYGRDRFALFTGRRLEGHPSVVRAAPDGLLDQLQHEHLGRARMEHQSIATSARPDAAPGQQPVRDPQAYAAAALRNEIQRVEQASEGERNNALNRASFALGRFVGGGLLDLEEVREQLAAAALARGLEPGEVAPTIASGLSAGVLAPLEGTEPSVGSVGSSPGASAPRIADPSVSSVGPFLGDAPVSHAASVGSVSTPSGGSSGFRASATGLPHPSVGSTPVWAEIRPLPALLPTVVPFDYVLLPKTLRPWIEDIAERMQCPPDYPSVASVIGLAALVGRKVGIRPKRFDDWIVVPNLWGTAIGRPGLMKSPALLEPLRPLKQFEYEARKRHEEEMKAHEASMIVEEERRKVQRRAIGKALQDGADPTRLAKDLVDGSKEAPARQRFLVNDTTVEKLGEILAENPNGVLIFRDELVGFLRTLDKEGHENARSFYLEAWNGVGSYCYDRISRGTIDIDAAIVSILGCIQPGPLGDYLRAAVRSGSSDDGFAQRFQLAVWPDCPVAWRNVDRWPDSPARAAAYAVYQRLAVMDPIAVGADQGGDDEIPFLRFSPEAQDMFDSWREQLERRLRNDDEHPAIESHLAKYRSLIPSLALLLHLAEDSTGPVSAGALGRAVAWGVYLESHARRLYSQAINTDIVAARALATHITKRDIGPVFALRDLYRRGWTGLSSKEEATLAVEYLEELGWLAVSEKKTAGRPAVEYHVNPRIWQGAPDQGDRTDGRRGDTAAVLETDGAGSPELPRGPADRTDGRSATPSANEAGERRDSAVSLPETTDRGDRSPASEPSGSSVGSSREGFREIATGEPKVLDLVPGQVLRRGGAA